MKFAINARLIVGYAYESVGTLIVIGLEFLRRGVFTLLVFVCKTAPQIFIPEGVTQKTGLFNFSSTLIIASK